jgi:ketosteroid isomerase-like protein
MSDHDIEANKTLARQFIAVINKRSLEAMDALLHDDFVWNTAVAPDDGPNELVPLQSKRLRGTNLPHPKPRLNRPESMAFFAGIFGTPADGNPTPEGGFEMSDDHGHMHFDILNLTAEQDRVAIEATSTGISDPETGKTYGNFYHSLMRISDGKVLLYKEYQDTLRVYDYVSDLFDAAAQ